jgi:hypothetical protein
MSAFKTAYLRHTHVNPTKNKIECPFHYVTAALVSLEQIWQQITSLPSLNTILQWLAISKASEWPLPASQAHIRLETGTPHTTHTKHTIHHTAHRHRTHNTYTHHIYTTHHTQHTCIQHTQHTHTKCTAHTQYTIQYITHTRFLTSITLFILSPLLEISCSTLQGNFFISLRFQVRLYCSLLPYFRGWVIISSCFYIVSRSYNLFCLLVCFKQFEL